MAGSVWPGAPRRAVLVVCLALALATLAGPRAPAATKPAATEAPSLAANAWILVDAANGEQLAGHDAARSLPIASATKLMTAQLALERLELDRLLSAPVYRASPAESRINLRAGERMSVRDLLYALVLESANDAAVTLAHGVAGSVPGFVGEMNASAAALGLADTSFANPIGLDQPGNHSSARDLAALARRLLDRPAFARIADTARRTLRSGAKPRTIETRNRLLRTVPWVTGVKTGHTRGAGYVLVSSAERDGARLISVVLGARSEAARDAETLRLLGYGFRLHAQREIEAQAKQLGESVARAAGGDSLLDRARGRAAGPLGAAALVVAIVILVLAGLRLRVRIRRRTINSRGTQRSGR